MGGGGILNKMIPGYKDIIWNRLPLELRKVIISKQHANFERTLHRNCISATSSVQQYDSAVGSRFAPDYSARTPVIDYKRQLCRGTLVEGRDVFLPISKDQVRLVNLQQPYSDLEQVEREQFARYDLKFTLALIFGGLLVYDFKQSRPIAWCLVFDAAKPRQPWYHESLLHSHDVKSVRRGFEVFRSVCSSCHSLKKCKWWYLMKDVYPVRRVQEFAAEKTMVDGLNDEGELNVRPCMTWDYFPRPFPTEEAAKEANNGKEPPDFSEGPYFFRGGADYVFAILTGFRDPPVGLKLTEGTYYNPWFGGGVIGMSPPLEDGLVEFEDGTPATVSQMAKDVVSFLVFVSDPCHNERKLTILKATSGIIVALPFFFVMRRFAVGGAWNRRIDFDKLRHM